MTAKRKYVLIGFGAVVGIWVFLSAPQLIFYFAAPEKKLSIALQKDLAMLAKSEALHAGFQSLNEIKMVTTSQSLKDFNNKYPIGFETNPEGKFNLEIFMDEIESGGIVIQYDLVDKKTGNTIWELGRTFPYKLK